jgi:hypothetical protein
MTKEEAKKKKECDVFRRFCQENVGLLAYDDFNCCESPDFVRKDGSMGVELVAYHRDACEMQQGDPDEKRQDGSNLRRREAQLERLLNEAKNLTPNSSRLEVYAFPRSRNADSMPSSVPSSAKDELVRFILKSIASKAAADKPPERLPPILDAVFEDITVDEIQPHEVSNWQVVSADWVDVSIPAIHARLKEKDPFVPQYRKRARAVWLLIYGDQGVFVGPGDHGRWSPCGHVTRELETALFSSSFDRVYYFDQDIHDGRKCVRLNVAGEHTADHPPAL